MKDCTRYALCVVISSISQPSAFRQCSVEDPIAQKAVEKFGAKAIKQYSKQFRSLHVQAHLGDPRYKEAVGVIQAMGISVDQFEEHASDESDSESELSRVRNTSPMKPSTRRKTRFVMFLTI